MPLIDSHRLTDEDRSAWPAMIRRYREPAWKVEQRARVAQHRIRRFVGAGGAHVGVSWGKDSVVVAHLARLVSAHIPLVWLRMSGAENPDCVAVRDAFLSDFPSNYAELARTVVWEDGVMAMRPWSDLLAAQRSDFGARRITGIRSQESGVRSMSALVHGIATNRSCRPILDWSTAQVFAYLLRFDLPIHPAYAMTQGGRLDMERLRVDFVGDEAGRDQGRREWELAYYGDRPPYTLTPPTS